MPPGTFATSVVELAVMLAAKRHDELVADLGTEGCRLGEADVVCIRRVAVADDARLRRDVAQMVLVADAFGLTQR